VRDGETVLGGSGGLDEVGEVDPWSHFVNSFVIDRDGNRIDRRNAEDIFTSLYNHQIPPGAADVVHYRLNVPEEVTGPLTVTARLLYRKFDTTLLRYMQGADFVRNDLPIMTLARDSVTFQVGDGPVPENPEREVPQWQRWNDFGIGLLRKGGRGELAAAEAAFGEVEALGRPDGPLNRARVYIREGRIGQEAPEALERAATFDPPAPAWSVLYFGGLVNKQNGNFDAAIDDFKSILEGGFEQARGRGFDFSKDYRLLNELANTLFQRAKQERGESRAARRRDLLEEAVSVYEKALEYDPENAQAHYGLSQVHQELGDTAAATRHAEQHEYYRPDDNARDQAVASARIKYPAASQAAEPSAIFDLHRDGRERYAPAAHAGGPAND
ncbi:MAG: tetratricopeptide repeat protein, partial [Planctomycetota bacterium]|jgi:tetratricopeptide (TPR) repeat protein